jgi:hypothetical protein
MRREWWAKGWASGLALTSTVDVILAGYANYNFPLMANAYNSNVSKSGTTLGALGYVAKGCRRGENRCASSPREINEAIRVHCRPRTDQHLLKRYPSARGLHRNPKIRTATASLEIRSYSRTTGSHYAERQVWSASTEILLSQLNTRFQMCRSPMHSGKSSPSCFPKNCPDAAGKV